MFPYEDPTGTNLLSLQGALEAYRSKLHGRYLAAASEPGTLFKTIEDFQRLRQGRAAKTVMLDWKAFPVRKSGIPDMQIDRDRAKLQEEYVEWSDRDDSDNSTITFSTEFSEYYEALADVSFEALAAGLQSAIPEATAPTAQELLGLRSPPPPLDVDGKVGAISWEMLNRVTQSASDSRAEPFVKRGDRGPAVLRLQQRLQQLNLLDSADGVFGRITESAVVQAQQKYVGGGLFFKNHRVQNPWNNGQRGIHCLLHKDSTLNLLFNLASRCCVPLAGDARDTCQLVAPACVPSRSSDPIICTAAQRLVKANHLMTLKDPVRIQIQKLTGRWRLNGLKLDINNPSENQGIWTVSRGGQRGVLKRVPSLEVDSRPIRTGAQVARQLIVGAEVLFITQGVSR